MNYLTPASLIASLENIAASQTEQERSVQLVTAATLIQDSVLAGVEPTVFDAAIDSVTSRLQPYLNAVMNRTVDFHAQSNGSTLGLWLLPVIVAIDNANLPPVLPLETDSLNLLKMGGLLLKQLGLATAVDRAKAGKSTMGWTHVIPALYSLEQITSADLHALVDVTLQARAVVRGDRADIAFNCGPEVEPRPGECLYFLPVVVNHPEGAPLTMPAACQVTAARLTTWVASTIRQQNDGLEALVHVAQAPHPFTVALDAGERFELDFKVRNLLGKVSVKANIHAHGMAALVAPYAINGGESYVLGITLVSRMTNTVLATLAIPVKTDGQSEAQLAANTLREVGLESIQLSPDAIGSVECQHCGGLQYAHPSHEVAARGMLAMAPNIQ